MARKQKVILISVLAVAVLVLGAIGGIALADSASSTSSGNTLIAKVATILGIDQTKVQAAFDQAQKEMQSEALDTYLAAQVKAGKITQAQADQYKAWWNSKPAGVDALGPGFGGGFGGDFRHGGRGMKPPTDSTTSGTTGSTTN